MPSPAQSPTAAGSSSGQQTQGGNMQAASAPINPYNLVFFADMLIVALVGLVILWRLPRAIARYSRKASWLSGHFLRRGPPAVQITTDGMMFSEPAMSSKKNGSESSHTSFTVRQQGHRPATNYLPHVPSYWRIIRSTSPTLQTRIVPGFTLGQVLLLFLYFCCLVYLPFYDSNPFTDSKREGYVAMSQLPFVFLFAAKNSVFGSLTGLGYEKLNFVHRFAGRCFVVAVDVHALGYIYRWAIAGQFTQRIAATTNTWGLVGLICANILIFFSASFWRRKAYNLFLCSHIVGYVVLIPACWYHKPIMRPYLIAVVALVVYDRLMRLAKSRLAMAMIRPMPELGSTRVEIPNLKGGWMPGQHVRLMIVSSTMGWFGWSEVHPFTIASVAESQEGIVLMCKKTGTWTSNLFEAAKMGGYALSAGVERKVRVHVEGPYGGGGHTLFPSFSGAMLVAGGSGITFALSALQDMLQKDMTGESRVKVIDLLWMIQDPTSLAPLIPTFAAILEQSYLTKVRISVYYTRSHALETKLPFAPNYFPPNLTLSPGRPKLHKVLDSIVSKSVTLGSGAKDNVKLSGILVGCCGPVGLGDECARAVGMIDPSRRDQVGGIELHEEAFGW